MSGAINVDILILQFCVCLKKMYAPVMTFCMTHFPFMITFSKYFDSFLLFMDIIEMNLILHLCSKKYNLFYVSKYGSNLFIKLIKKKNNI